MKTVNALATPEAERKRGSQKPIRGSVGWILANQKLSKTPNLFVYIRH